MTVKHFIGIDPGLSGAVGVLDAGGRFVGCHDMPVSISTTGRRALCPAGLAATLRLYPDAFALVERVGARPGEGAVGAFSFGQTYGGILAVLASLGIPHDIVQPATWKRRAGIPAGADKAVSISTALRRVPDAQPYLTRKKDDGRAEALLLAIQAREQTTGQT